MKLAKLIVVLAVGFAAAVLFPLRRAQGAFANRSAMAGASVVAAPRPPLRRRPSGLRVAVRRDCSAKPAATTLASFRARGAGKASHPSQAVSPAEASGAIKQQSQRPAPSAERAHHAAQGAAQGDCDRMIDRVEGTLRPEPSGAVGPAGSFVVTARTVDDIPEPPPKHAAL